MQQNKLNEAYARLLSMKANVPVGDTVGQQYVREFHDILGIMEKNFRSDLSAFRVPASEIRPRFEWGWRDSDSGEGQNSYSEPECDRAYLVMKIDGVLTLVRPTPRSIGFSSTLKTTAPGRDT